METQEKTLEQVLEEGQERFPEITELYQWSTNYRAGQTPFTLFADLIGWSEENIGSKTFDYFESINKTFGYLELDYLADALKEYANKGQDAYEYASAIIDAEGRE